MTDRETRLWRAEYLWGQSVRLENEAKALQAQAKTLRDTVVEMTTPKERERLTAGKQGGG